MASFLSFGARHRGDHGLPEHNTVFTQDTTLFDKAVWSTKVAPLLESFFKNKEIACGICGVIESAFEQSGQWYRCFIVIRILPTSGHGRNIKVLEWEVREHLNKHGLYNYQYNMQIKVKRKFPPKALELIPRGSSQWFIYRTDKARLNATSWLPQTYLERLFERPLEAQPDKNGDSLDTIQEVILFQPVLAHNRQVCDDKVSNDSSDFLSSLDKQAILISREIAQEENTIARMIRQMTTRPNGLRRRTAAGYPETSRPETREANSNARSVKHLTCWYWLNTLSGCSKSKEECLYAHHDTGLYTEQPRTVIPGGPVIAGKNAERVQAAVQINSNFYNQSRILADGNPTSDVSLGPHYAGRLDADFNDDNHHASEGGLIHGYDDSSSILPVAQTSFCCSSQSSHQARIYNNADEALAELNARLMTQQGSKNRAQNIPVRSRAISIVESNASQVAPTFVKPTGNRAIPIIDPATKEKVIVDKSMGS